MASPLPARSRFLRKARAVHLARLVAAGALVIVPTACARSDADVFGAAATTTSPMTGTAPSTAPPSATAPASTAAPPSGTAPPGTTASTAAPSTTAPPTVTFPAGADVVIGFTYAPSAAGGRINNPYVAVWVEDRAGNLVKTVSLWYEQSGKGTRWLNELAQWYSAGGGDDTTTSGATRAAGSYTVAWDGTDLDGQLVAAGDYVLFVEAAREHGPYEITSSAITVGPAGFDVTLPDDGELSRLSARLSA